MVDSGILSHLAESVGNAFHRETRVGSPLEDPSYAYSSDRGQYLATAILRRLAQALQSDEERLLGIVDVDMYVPELSFVFGLADPQRHVAVISLTRLQSSFYGEPPNRALCSRRATKEALHELGHTYGLRHCPDPDCVMHFSNLIEDTDRKRAVFCPGCGLNG